LVVLAAALSAGLDAFLSIFMMRSVDAATSLNRDLFKQEVVKLLFIALSLIPVTVALSFSKGLYKRKTVVAAKVSFIKGVFNKNINEFQRDNNSKYVSALTNDVNTIESSYIDGLYEVTVNIVNFLAGIIVIGYVSPIALLGGIGIGLLSAAVSILISKPVQKHLTQRSELYEHYTSYIKEVLSAFHIIKSNNLSEKVRKDFHAKSSAIQHKGYVIDKIYTYISSLQNFNMTLTMYGLLAITVLMAIKGRLTLGGVILVVNNIERIMTPISQLGESMPKIFSSRKLFAKIEDTLRNYNNYNEVVTIEGLRDSIEFSNVSFAYEDTEVLKDITLSLKKGGKYLIVGPSGGGKSTLLKLLRKYYSPKSGNIQIDGNNLRDVTKESYFHHISNVEQQVFLFEDTVRNNITLYKDYSEEDIDSAIEKAGLKDFIAGLINGLESIIYDNGKNVSGGEKSRIAIARGLLQKSDIIFLDEAFASLDSKIAKEIENTLLSLDGITIINVSHVIFEETKKRYNNVFVVKNTKVSAAG
jgi:ATP-binding cassette subfamily C protein